MKDRHSHPGTRSLSNAGGEIIDTGLDRKQRLFSERPYRREPSLSVETKEFSKKVVYVTVERL